MLFRSTGPGIEEAQLGSIFEEFRRGEGAVGQGLGLGLAISERIARLLDAPLRVRSRPGRGTVFSLSLGREAGPRGLAAVPPRARLADARLLAVDNDPVALDALAGVLRGWGCQVVAVANGDQAERALESDPCGLWLFDYHLDDGDTGVALHARLARRFGARPALILSADDSVEVRRDVLEDGLALLSKPVRPLALKSVLDRMLAAQA